MKKPAIWLLILVILGLTITAYLLIKNQSGKLQEANTGISMKNLPEGNPGSHFTTTTKSKTMKTYTTQPAMTLDKNKSYGAILKTSEGDITIELNTKETPITVNNFVFLAKEGFYNGVIFHRIIKGFMIQGGDPTGTGMGGPGYEFNDEKFVGEYTKGTVAMANAGPNTNGSQFFIMHKDVPLQKDYVIFGKVIQGMEVVDRIANLPVKSVNGENSTPVNPPVINSVEIIEKVIGIK